jgi:hypothetical protein
MRDVHDRFEQLPVQVRRPVVPLDALVAATSLDETERDQIVPVLFARTPKAGEAAARNLVLGSNGGNDRIVLSVGNDKDDERFALRRLGQSPTHDFGGRRVAHGNHSR